MFMLFSKCARSSSKAQPSSRLNKWDSVAAFKLEFSAFARFHEFHSRIVSYHGADVCLARRPGQRAIVHWNNHLRLK